MVSVVAGRPGFLRAEGEEHHRQPQRLGRPRGQPGHLEQHGHPGGVVLRARRLRDGVQVGTEDQVCLVRNEPGRRGDHVDRPPGRHRDSPGHPLGGSEGLLAHGVPEAPEPLGHQVGGLPVGRRRRLARADVAGESADVLHRGAGLELGGSRRRRARRHRGPGRRPGRPGERTARQLVNPQVRGRRHRAPGQVGRPVRAAGHQHERGGRYADHPRHPPPAGSHAAHLRRRRWVPVRREPRCDRDVDPAATTTYAGQPNVRSV